MRTADNGNIADAELLARLGLQKKTVDAPQTGYDSEDEDEPKPLKLEDKAVKLSPSDEKAPASDDDDKPLLAAPRKKRRQHGPRAGGAAKPAEPADPGSEDDMPLKRKKPLAGGRVKAKARLLMDIEDMPED
jgi:hypothetical protein